MSKNIIIPEEMHDRLKSRKNPITAPTFSAVYQRMMDEVETHPPEEVEKWWTEESVQMITIKINDNVYCGLWNLQDGPKNDLSFRAVTQWLLDSTQGHSDDEEAKLPPA